MGVGETPALEIGHRVALAPDDIVEDPEAELLEDGADAVDIVIGADDPQRAVVLQQSLGGLEPFAGEAVIVGEARELVPALGDAVDDGVVGAAQFGLELQIVGRIGEHHVDRLRGEAAHDLDGLADVDVVDRGRIRPRPDLPSPAEAGEASAGAYGGRAAGFFLRALRRARRARLGVLVAVHGARA